MIQKYKKPLIIGLSILLIIIILITFLKNKPTAQTQIEKEQKEKVKQIDDSDITNDLDNDESIKNLDKASISSLKEEKAFLNEGVTLKDVYSSGYIPEGKPKRVKNPDNVTPVPTISEKTIKALEKKEVKVIPQKIEKEAIQETISKEDNEKRLKAMYSYEGAEDMQTTTENNIVDNSTNEKINNNTNLNKKGIEDPLINMNDAKPKKKIGEAEREWEIQQKKKEIERTKKLNQGKTTDKSE